MTDFNVLLNYVKQFTPDDVNVKDLMERSTWGELKEVLVEATWLRNDVTGDNLGVNQADVESFQTFQETLSLIPHWSNWANEFPFASFMQHLIDIHERLLASFTDEQQIQKDWANNRFVEVMKLLIGGFRSLGSPLSSIDLYIRWSEPRQYDFQTIQNLLNEYEELGINRMTCYSKREFVTNWEKASNALRIENRNGEPRDETPSASPFAQISSSATRKKTSNKSIAKWAGITAGATLAAGGLGAGGYKGYQAYQRRKRPAKSSSKY